MFLTIGTFELFNGILIFHEVNFARMLQFFIFDDWFFVLFKQSIAIVYGVGDCFQVSAFMEEVHFSFFLFFLLLVDCDTHIPSQIGIPAFGSGEYFGRFGQNIIPFAHPQLNF